MNTLHRIREFALVAILATGTLIASATQADERRPSGERSVARSIAHLGEMTVLGRRLGEIADLGSMTVTARRLSDTLVADLGTMTVSARRTADTQVADLGGMTVTARRIATVTVAAQPSNHSWN